MICKIYKWHKYAANHREICSLMSCTFVNNSRAQISLTRYINSEVDDAFWSGGHTVQLSIP